MEDFIEFVGSLIAVALALLFTLGVLTLINPLFWVGLTLILIFKMVS